MNDDMTPDNDDLDDDNLDGDGLDGDGLVDDLRQLITLRTRTSVRDRPFPVLVGLLDPEDRHAPDRRYRALSDLIDTGIDRIDDPAHRRAAAALLGGGDGRWRTVAARGSEAAREFGCGWDAYRRKRASGASQLDDTLEVLAESLRTAAATGQVPAAVDGDFATLGPTAAGPTATGPTGATSTVVLGPITPGTIEETEPGAPTHETPRRFLGLRRRDALTAVLVILAVLAGAGIAWNARSDHGHSEQAGQVDSGDRPESCDQLTFRPGDKSEKADPEITAWAPRFATTSQDLHDGVGVCAGVMDRLNDLVIQPISDGSPTGVGALIGVEGEPPRVLMLYHREYWVYRNFTLTFGEIAGSPYRRADRDDGTRVVKLTQGIIVSREHQDAYLVFGTVYNAWREHGGIDGDMGRPVSNQRDVPDVGRVQDFEHGRVTIDFVDPTIVEWKEVPNPAELLPPSIGETVVVADDGSAWWIDASRVRHWLPTTNDFGCVSVLGGPPIRDVPIIAIATLPLGEPSRCR